MTLEELNLAVKLTLTGVPIRVSPEDFPIRVPNHLFSYRGGQKKSSPGDILLPLVNLPCSTQAGRQRTGASTGEERLNISLLH